MTNVVSNAVCNAVTPHVTRRVRGCVQNQSQNQTVVKSFSGSLITSASKAKFSTREGLDLDR